MLLDYFTRRQSTRRSFVALLLTVALSACTSQTTTETLSASNSIADITTAGLLDQYRIGVGDALTISVWRNPELSAQVVVLPDGNISVPLVGDVSAAGQTTEELASAISDVLDNYIRQPEVTVSVTRAVSSEYLQRIRITGAVGSPLSVPFRRGLTVLDLVLLSGGTTPFANPNKALLYRTESDGLKVYSIRLNDILKKGVLDTNYSLLPSDIITVPEKNF